MFDLELSDATIVTLAVIGFTVVLLIVILCLLSINRYVKHMTHAVALLVVHSQAQGPVQTRPRTITTPFVDDGDVRSLFTEARGRR